MREITNTVDGKAAWINPAQVVMMAPARDEKGNPLMGHSLLIMAPPQISPLGCNAIERTAEEVGTEGLVNLPSHDGVPVYVNPAHVAAVVVMNSQLGGALVGQCALFLSAPHLAPLQIGLAPDDAAVALGGTAAPLVTLA